MLLCRRSFFRPSPAEDVERLVADLLHCDTDRVVELARLIYDKTAGNPFFTIQFMSALYEEALLTFDRRNARWSWDVNRIHAKAYTDNVVDLMTGKLNRLPPETQKALRQLACLGNLAENTTLCVACEKGEEELRVDLGEATRLGYIVQLDGAYKFVHDRVQEAAYSLIPEERRAEAHIRIGRLLIARTSSEKQEDFNFRDRESVQSRCAVDRLVGGTRAGCRAQPYCWQTRQNLHGLCFRFELFPRWIGAIDGGPMGTAIRPGFRLGAQWG